MENQPSGIEPEHAIDQDPGTHTTLHDLRMYAYVEWKRHGHHYLEYACEFIGTALLVAAVIGAVAVVQAGSSPLASAIKSLPLKLLLTGLIISVSSMFITISPFGRLSGAHLNPAISLGFWQLGKLHTRDLIGYIVSQMAGGLVGALVARPLFGMLAREVKYAAMAPGPHIDVAMAFTGEFVCTFVMAIAIYYFVSHVRLARWTPFMLVPLIPVLVLSDATISGCGMNPARWIGPAYLAHIWMAAWIYLVGPMAGATLAVLIRRSGIAENPIPITAKLFHDVRYRSLFKHDEMLTRVHGITQAKPSADK